MAEDKKTIGKNIKKARILAELTQKELAEKLGFDRQVVIRMEGGFRKVPADELKKIAEITKQPISFFYDELDFSDSYTKIILNKGIRDLSDLPDDDLRFVDELIQKLRKKYFKE